jgi:hypothetical protein
MRAAVFRNAVGVLAAVASTVVLALPWAACDPPRRPPAIGDRFSDDFERADIGPEWRETGPGWRIANGSLVGQGVRNHPLWLRRRLPRNAHIAFDAWSESPNGDLKCEVYGDGESFAREASYTATSYVVIFGGWFNSLNVIARMDEHAADRRVRRGPRVEVNRHYRFDRARNIVGNECMNFANIDTQSMKDIAKASILANEALWFAVNMGFDQSTELGLMKHRLYDYEVLFGIDLALSKADRTRFHAGASGHAMALVGMDLEAGVQPRTWLVENSWGDEKGDKGLWTLHDDWFDEHVYTIIAHRSHVPASVLKCFDEEPTVLPSWYPGARANHGTGFSC